MIAIKKNRKSGAHSLVKQHILSNFSPGDQLPGENELIKHLRTSRYAVLKGMTELSAEGVLERRQGKGTFMIRAKSNKDFKNSQIIAFVADEFESNMIVEIARGIEEYLRSSKFSMLLLNSSYDAEQECRNLNQVVEHQYAGVIAMLGPHSKALECAAELPRKGIPLVQIDRHYSAITSPWVETDHKEGAYQAVHHLIELGHRKIGHITFNEPQNRSITSVEQRFAGYRRALTEAGIEFRQDYVQYARTFAVSSNIYDEAMELAAYEPAHKLISMPDRPTALFLMNDCFAPGVLRAILNHGLRVPDDISLIGFDDGPIAKYLQVPLTTLAQPFREIGRKAAEIIEKTLDGNPAAEWKIKLPGKLIIRNSTAEVKNKQ